jgi:hypothetical protein
MAAFRLCPSLIYHDVPRLLGPLGHEGNQEQSDTIKGKMDAAKADLDWVKSQMVRFSPLINMGVDAYNAFKQHKKMYESAIEDLLTGELYTLTKINSIANNLQQHIHDLCDNHRHPPQTAIDTQ